MTWQLFEIAPDADYDVKDQPGAYWFVPAYAPDGEQRQHFLDRIASAEYKRDWADKRAPIMVCLPSRSWWLIDQRIDGNESGWTITGEAPNLTAHPSINHVGLYHGWLQNGVLTDDVEGRTYP